MKQFNKETALWIQDGWKANLNNSFPVSILFFSPKSTGLQLLSKSSVISIQKNTSSPQKKLKNLKHSWMLTEHYKSLKKKNVQDYRS